MAQPDFLQSLRSELHLRAVPFDGAALGEFAASVFPLVEDAAAVDVTRWADEFLAYQLPLLVESVAESMRT
jgi:hypothetical protein